MDLDDLVCDLAERAHEGELTPEEKAEYRGYIKADTFAALLQSAERQQL